MDLSKALRIQSGEVVAFVGAGGKTSSLRKIVQELHAQLPVFVTTTTKLARGEASLATHHFVIRSQNDLESAFSSLPDAGSALFTGGEVEAGEKLSALLPDLLTRLIARAQECGAIVLIEADGARGSLIKAPAEHEPVIPAETTMVVPIIRIDAMGISVSDTRIHRPEQMTSLLGIEAETVLSIEHLARLLTHASGGLKNIPEHACMRVFINGAETSGAYADARSLAPLLLEEGRIRSVLIGSLQQSDPVLEVWGRTGIVVLAAGASKRFGEPKLVQHWHGKTILRHVVERVLESECRPALLVLGAHADQLKQEIRNLPIEVVHNPAWSEGQSRSLQIGLQALQERCEAVIFALGDMPDLSLGSLQALVDAHRKGLHPVVAPHAGGRLGNPVLFDATTFSALLALEGDIGGRAIFDQYPPHTIPADETVLKDIDTPEDLHSTPRQA